MASQGLITLGNTIRKLRKKQGLSQEELAYKANIHRTYMGDVERGERNIAVLNILKIAKALNIKPSTLFSDLDKIS